MRKRKRLIGLNIRTLEKGETVQATLDTYSTHQLKSPTDDGRTELPYVELTDLDSADVFQLWLNAGLKEALRTVKVGSAVEIMSLGKVEFTTKDGKAAMVNQYKVYELENAE